ncbi:MAG: MarR family winged helix-turn-helix transcriptional regulator [Pseudomonadota bacterium]|nr:MarR family winged helix-turn-helix transcriptional regulator [Pseudomonadota bacterium]
MSSSGPSSSKSAAPLTVSREELLRDGSDFEFRRMVHLFFAFLARHEAVRDGHARVIGLPGVDYTVLIAISHLNAGGETVSVNRLSEHLRLSGAFITTVTNRLAKAEIINKVADTEDRRRVCLTLAPAGREMLERLAPTQRQVNDLQFAPVGSEDLDYLVNMLERLVDSSETALKLQDYLSAQASAKAGE